MTIGEAGFITSTAWSTAETTWQSLTSWSESKRYFFLYFGRKWGDYRIIPKRAFTDEQIRKFRVYADRIYAFRSSQTLEQTASSIEQNGKHIGNYLPRISKLNDTKPLIEKKGELMGRVFLSYAREDLSTAVRLFNDLREAGIDVWLDSENLLPGQNWKVIIRNEIKESRFFLALLSNHSIGKRGYVQNELKHALEILDEYPETKIFIVPIRVDDCNPVSEKLTQLHWIDIFKDWDGGLMRIIKAIKSQSDV